MKLNLSGNWAADVSRSAFVGPKPAAMQITIDHRDPELREDLSVTRADGTIDRAVLECRTTGEEGTLLFNQKQLRGAAKWIGEELIIESWATIGERELHFCDCWSLSPDSQILVMEHRNDALAGQRVVCQRKA